MQLLTTTRVYDVPNDQSDPEFLELVQSPPNGVIIYDGNAGLGADWPAGVWTSLNAMVIALAIFDAPSTIEENWPKWKAIYDSVAEQVMEFHGEFRIDRDSAQVIAMQCAVAELGLEAQRFSVHMATRHFFTTVPGYEDLLNSPRQVMEWSDNLNPSREEFSNGVRSNEEAARQACCRYIFGIADDTKSFTIVVEQSGEVSFVKDFDMNRNWG